MEQTILSLISGFIGAVVGAGATVWATHKTIKRNAEEYEERQNRAKKEEYQNRLKSLQGEIDFNLALITVGDKKIPVFIYVAWENFLPHSLQLNNENRKLLNEAYSWAISHNSAAKLERVGVQNYSDYIDRSFNNAMEKFKEFKKCQFGESE